MGAAHEVDVYDVMDTLVYGLVILRDFCCHTYAVLSGLVSSSDSMFESPLRALVRLHTTISTTFRPKVEGVAASGVKIQFEKARNTLLKKQQGICKE
jgi:hypothetical protein